MHVHTDVYSLPESRREATGRHAGLSGVVRDVLGRRCRLVPRIGRGACPLCDLLSRWGLSGNWLWGDGRGLRHLFVGVHCAANESQVRRVLLVVLGARPDGVRVRLPEDVRVATAWRFEHSGAALLSDSAVQVCGRHFLCLFSGTFT